MKMKFTSGAECKWMEAYFHHWFLEYQCNFFGTKFPYLCYLNCGQNENRWDSIVKGLGWPEGESSSLLLTSFVMLDKLFCFPKPRFPHLQNRSNHCTYNSQGCQDNNIKTLGTELGAN